MLCSVTDGDLPLTLKWYRHDQLLMPAEVAEAANAASGISVTNIGQYESVLRIDNLRPEHNANFTCVAQNYAGISQHSQVLRVKGTERCRLNAQIRTKVNFKEVLFLVLHHIKFKSCHTTEFVKITINFRGLSLYLECIL